MSGMARRVARAVIVVALLAADSSAVGAAVPSTARAGDVLYPVRQGDTLYRLAARYFATPQAMQRVRRLNRVADVHRLPAGRDLRIPRGLLRDEPTPARIESFSGEVTLRQGPAAPVPAAIGTALTEGTIIETGRRGFLSLRLADDSTVTIPSQSAVQVIRLRRVLINNAVEREFRALSGRVRAKVTPMSDPASSFRVGTPITVSAVRGTDFRVAFDPAGQRALTEVEDGKVQFGVAASSSTPAAAAGTDTALLTAGFGAVARPGAMGAATALLPAPRLVAPDRAQTDPELAFAIEPDPGAAGYRIQVGRDAGLLDVVDEATGAEPRFVLGSLPTGTYFVRVSLLDGNGAEGLGHTYAFDRVLNAVSGALSSEGRRYRFKWSSVTEGQPQFRFRLTRKTRGDAPSAAAAVPVVDQPMGTATEISVTALRPGEYSWQVLSIVPFGSKLISTWSSPQQFEVTGRR